jgi:hypothetical protein
VYGVSLLCTSWDDGQVNNYEEWKTKAELQLLSWDLLRYVTGPDSTLLNIPDLHEPFIQRSSDPADLTGMIKLFCIHGNAAKCNQVPSMDDKK